MIADIQDTIVALSSAPGQGGRAIVRLSGPSAFEISFTFFESTDQQSAADSGLTEMVRRRHEGFLCLPEFQPSIPASLLAWPGQKTLNGTTEAIFSLLPPPLCGGI